MKSQFQFCLADDGARIGYRRFGQGPVMLLIAGLGGEAKFWNAAAESLAIDHEVIVYDQRGFGVSSDTESVCSVDLLAQDAKAILDAVGAEHAITVGHSTGGAIAQTMALTHPERVSHLILSSTWAKADAYMRYLFALRSNVMRTGGSALFADLTRIIGYPLQWLRDRPELLTESAEALRESIDYRVLTRIEALLAFDRSGVLGDITQPTLVLGARDDQIVPNYLHIELVEAIPHATANFCEGGGHFYPAIDPASLTVPVLDWLRA